MNKQLASTSPKQFQVFLVDDTPGDRLMLEFSRRYSFPTCTFLVFENGSSLLETLSALEGATTWPDVIFLNRQGPGQSSLQIYRLLQAHPRWAAIQTVILPGHVAGEESTDGPIPSSQPTSDPVKGWCKSDGAAPEGALRAT